MKQDTEKIYQSWNFDELIEELEQNEFAARREVEIKKPGTYFVRFPQWAAVFVRYHDSGIEIVVNDKKAKDILR